MGETNMKMKRVCSVLLAATLLGSMSIMPVQAAPNTEELQSQKKQTQQEVQSLQTQLSDLMTDMNVLQTQLVENGEQIIQVQAQLEESEKKQEKQREDMMLRIKYMYEEGAGANLEKVLKSGTIREMLTQAEYAQKIHEYDRTQLEEYVATVNKTKELKQTLEEKQASLEQTAAEYEVQQTQLNTLITEKSEEIQNLDEQIQKAAAEAAAEAARRAEEERRKQEEAQRAAQQNLSTNTNTTNNSNTTNTTGNTENTGGGSQEQTPEEPSTPTTPTPQAPQTPTVSEPSSNSGNAASIRQTIVNAAWSQIGVPYVWGGNSPGVGLDCSGLTQYAYRTAGLSIPRTDITQLNAGRITSNPQPGDICWTPGHVAIYIGNGQMIEAQQTGVPICVSSVRATYYVTFEGVLY